MVWVRRRHPRVGLVLASWNAKFQVLWNLQVAAKSCHGRESETEKVDSTRLLFLMMGLHLHLPASVLVDQASFAIPASGK